MSAVCLSVSDWCACGVCVTTRLDGHCDVSEIAIWSCLSKVHHLTVYAELCENSAIHGACQCGGQREV